MDWKDNPFEFSYKINAAGAPLKGDLTSVREFEIYNCCKYVNATVKIDRLTKAPAGVKNELAPVWIKENLFLKVLLEGKAKLYGYEGGKIKQYY